MKKNSLATAVIAGLIGLAGFAGLANATHLNPDGLGHVLLYPYYTVNDNQTTVLAVDNTSQVAKAVKVRFLEGYNTRETIDFSLYLSPNDTWTAATFAGQGREYTSQPRPDLPEVFTPAIVDAAGMHERMRLDDPHVATSCLVSIYMPQMTALPASRPLPAAFVRMTIDEMTDIGVEARVRDRRDT